MSPQTIDPLRLLRPRRRIIGISAVLLPFTAGGDVDWPGFTAHVRRTLEAGLTPAVNMDTGFAHLLDQPTRLKALDLTREVAAGRMWVAGAFVGDRPGDRFDRDAYLRATDQITARGGTPVIFQSYGLTGQDDAGLVASYAAIGERCGRFIAFE